MQEIWLVTGNLNKVKEMERLLGHKIHHIDIDLDEIQEMDIDKIATHKAKQAWEKVKHPIVIWDQSVHIHCLNGFPGPLIKWFWETVTLTQICKISQLLNDNHISTTTTFTYYDGKKLKHFHGTSKGTMPPRPRGTNGFGWDPIFIPEGSSLTYAEMEPNDPQLHLFNKQVLEKLKEYLHIQT